MKKISFINALTILTMLIAFSCKKGDALVPSIIVDHNCTKLSDIPEEWINKAKTDLHIAYGHTSHGSQLITGIAGLENWKGEPYLWNNGNLEGSLDLRDGFLPGDLGHNGDLIWEGATRSYLGDSRNEDINLIIWSWCGGVSDNTEAGIQVYLDAMNQLEADFPNVKFVYMTGHLDGTGLAGNLHIRNEQIRKFCLDNNKILYDFADIESYDPSGNYYGDKYATDGCNYDYNNDGQTDQTGDPALPQNGDQNWAIDWQNAHPGEWYSCSSAHSQPLNANLKAYAAWWLFARLAGWEGK